MPRIELDLYRRKYFVRTRYVRAFEFENATRKHHEGEGNHAMHDATYSTEPIILCIILNSIAQNGGSCQDFQSEASSIRRQIASRFIICPVPFGNLRRYAYKVQHRVEGGKLKGGGVGGGGVTYADAGTSNPTRATPEAQPPKLG
jgi:hypothetical protein